jgi:hypothetical protein
MLPLMHAFDSAYVALLARLWDECEALWEFDERAALRLQALRLDLHVLAERLPRLEQRGLLCADEHARVLELIGELEQRLPALDLAEHRAAELSRIQDWLLGHVQVALEPAPMRRAG